MDIRRDELRKRIITIIVTIGLATTLSMPIFAESLLDSYANQNKSYKQAQSKVEELEISIEKLDSDIEKIHLEVNKVSVKMDKTQLKIEKAKEDIQVADGNILAEEDLFNKRMRSTYMNGVGSYLEFLLDSAGIGDLISRTENIIKIVEYDNEIIEESSDNKNDIENQKQTLETEKTRLLIMSAENEDKISSLKDKKQKQSVLIEEAKKEQQSYADMISDRQAIANVAMNEINPPGNTNQINSINPTKNNVPESTLSKVNSSTSSNDIVNYASAFLGTPYVWGANGPKNFDCSGFVKYVYAHFGVSISRTTYTQIKEGSYVSKENLKPGDLIFFGTFSNPYHVAMYVGNNSYIHAPRTGDVVKISALTRSDYLTARRIK